MQYLNESEKKFINELEKSMRYTAGLLEKIPAFGNQIGNGITKAQLAGALHQIKMNLHDIEELKNKASMEVA